MLITPSTKAQAADLSLVKQSSERCSNCSDDCDGLRWVWDLPSSSAIRQLCPRASENAKALAALSMLADSGIPEQTTPIICSWLSGLTVVCPPWKASAYTHELRLRRTTAGIVAGWIVEKQSPALYVPYYMTTSYWRDDIKKWMTTPLMAFVGWHFRGLRQEHSCVFNDILLSRLDKGYPTVVCCSADPSLLLPRWVTDEPALDALQHPTSFVRVT